MNNKIKKSVKIGDTFMTWRVSKRISGKKYRYKCKCTECGQEKEFIKYNLINGNYAPCKKCGHKKLQNVSLIKKHWNSELNGVIFTHPENFSLTQSYWFICNKGHNFKSSIKDFKLERCLGCNEHPPNDPSKTQFMEFMMQYFGSFTKVQEYENYFILVPELEVVFHLHEYDRYTSYRNYFHNEVEMLNELDKMKQEEYRFKNLGFQPVTIKVQRDLKNNIDNLQEIMLELTQQFDVY